MKGGARVSGAGEAAVARGVEAWVAVDGAEAAGAVVEAEVHAGAPPCIGEDARPAETDPMDLLGFIQHIDAGEAGLDLLARRKRNGGARRCRGRRIANVKRPRLRLKRPPRWAAAPTSIP